MRGAIILAAMVALAGCQSEPVADGPVVDGAVDTAAAEYPGIPAEQAAQIAALGETMDPGPSYAIFAPLVPAPPYADVTIVADLAYGSDLAQKLDVYSANDAAGEARPVLIYVHGGGFIQGSKQGDYYPQSATAWAARNGMVGVNIDYRLAPAAVWPAGRDDLAAAIAWVAANIADYGGDPARIFLWGHSAGANHVADYVSHKELQGAEAARVKGALLLSPNYPAAAGEEPSPYYGSDAGLRTSDPVIERLGASTIPLLIAYAQYDPAVHGLFARAAEAQLCAAGSTLNCPQVLLLAGHNHFTEGASIGTADESLSGPLSAWMRGL